MSSESIKELHITSFGHDRGPLIPTPSLSFDIRSLPNPPRDLRILARKDPTAMMQWLVSNSQFQERLHDAHRTISRRLKDSETAGVDKVDVGVCCQLGRNRSYTFVEELGKLEWGSWTPVVHHREHYGTPFPTATDLELCRSEWENIRRAVVRLP
ncbi:hypothetical protein BDQ17DRAFT_1426860 [Cyathus striatus]|nr:hypothetical protein BDQ17DRAFT_1426860 [Cyathus striatus]